MRLTLTCCNEWHKFVPECAGRRPGSVSNSAHFPVQNEITRLVSWINRPQRIVCHRFPIIQSNRKTQKLNRLEREIKFISKKEDLPPLKRCDEETRSLLAQVFLFQRYHRKRPHTTTVQCKKKNTPFSR